MTIEPLRGEDVALLCAQPHAQLQIGALCFFEGAPLRDGRGRLRVAQLRGHVESRLAALPRFRQRIAPVLADVSAPVWVDDPDFDAARHTRHVELPEPGGPAALRAFMARLLSEPMDLAHPLWDIHTIEGFDEDEVAVVVRSHHVMADGLALYDAATLLLSPTPQPPTRSTQRWSPEPVAGGLHRSAASVTERVRRQASLVGGIGRVLFDPRRLVPNARVAIQAVGELRNSGLPRARAFPLTRPVGPRRAFAWDSLPMADVIAAKRACASTVNDVVLAIVTGALRCELEQRGEFDPGADEPRALVPIGARNPTDGALGNRFSFTTVALPVGVDDPLDRVALLHARMHLQETSVAQSFVPHLFAIADVVPVRVLRALVPAVLARQPFVDLAVSNIPGSRDPLYLCESRLLRMAPFITGVGNIALIVGVLSYLDGLGVGITVDPDVVGDPESVLDHVRAAASELARRVR
jgi:WS/DGAT/MGAT family acyltransferase